MKNRCLYVVAGALSLACNGALSQGYPSKPLRLIIPSAAGGSPDTNARTIAAELVKQMGQQIVAENRPGASGILGYEQLARAAPDGYTLAYVSNFIATNPSMYAKLPYSFERDFQPVALYFTGMNLLAVHNSVPARSVKELLAIARAQPGKLTFGSSGIGATPHLSMELLKSMTNTRMEHVPYKGTPQALTDLMAGQIDILCDNMAPTLPLVKAGRIRGLAVTGSQRAPSIPELPTIEEAGVPGYRLMGWAGIAVPAATPREIVMRLNAEINKALKSPTVLKAIEARSGLPLGGTPEEFGDHVRRETERLAKLIQAIGIKPQ
jgi:tripartite-type tricarboxylate transporter receptor subunit TctC